MDQLRKKPTQRLRRAESEMVGEAGAGGEVQEEWFIPKLFDRAGDGIYRAGKGVGKGMYQLGALPFRAAGHARQGFGQIFRDDSSEELNDDALDRPRRSMSQGRIRSLSAGRDQAPLCTLRSTDSDAILSNSLRSEAGSSDRGCLSDDSTPLCVEIQGHTADAAAEQEPYQEVRLTSSASLPTSPVGQRKRGEAAVLPDPAAARAHFLLHKASAIDEEFEVDAIQLLEENADTLRTMSFRQRNMEDVMQDMNMHMAKLQKRIEDSVFKIDSYGKHMRVIEDRLIAIQSKTNQQRGIIDLLFFILNWFTLGNLFVLRIILYLYNSFVSLVVGFTSGKQAAAVQVPTPSGMMPSSVSGTISPRKALSSETRAVLDEMSTSKEDDEVSSLFHPGSISPENIMAALQATNDTR